MGKFSYENALIKQEEFHSDVSNNICDETLIFVEHEPVYTLGKNADVKNILSDYPKDVKIFNIDRRGDVTYHGPGQIVGYPIVNIKKRNLSISRYIHTLEKILINTLKFYGIDAKVREKLIGVWVENEKIGAIGVRVKDGVTKHGFAINVNTDLSYFNGIIPYGINECKVTSMEQLLDKKIEMDEVKKVLLQEFTWYFK